MKPYEYPEYNTWRHMKYRCSDPACKKWAHYGGRGIKVCPQWMDFETFRKDVGPRPSPAHTLDRINNDGNYEPGNVRWATFVEQNNNRSNNKWIEFNGETLTMAQWSVKTGINSRVLHRRISRHKWDITRALTTPTRYQPPRK